MRRFLQSISKRMREAVFTPEAPEDIDVSRRTWELGVFYISEMDKCFSGGTFFAANIVGAAVLETVLLLVCLRYKSKVIATQKWQKIHKNEPPKPFSELLSGNRVGLAALLAIAEELFWFPNGIPPGFRQEIVGMVGEDKVRNIENGIPGVIGISQLGVVLSTALRNALHPGRSIKRPMAEHQFMSAISILSCLIALGNILETLQNTSPTPEVTS